MVQRLGMDLRRIGGDLQLLHERKFLAAHGGLGALSWDGHSEIVSSCLVALDRGAEHVAQALRLVVM